MPPGIGYGNDVLGELAKVASTQGTRPNPPLIGPAERDRYITGRQKGPSFPNRPPFPPGGGGTDIKPLPQPPVPDFLTSLLSGDGPIGPGGGARLAAPGPGPLQQPPVQDGGFGGGRRDLPREIWAQKLMGSKWFQGGQGPPAHMLNVLSERPALLRAIFDTPELLSLFQPYLDELGIGGRP